MTNDKNISSCFPIALTKYVFLFLIILCTLLASFVSAQDLKVNAELDTNKLLIGDHIHLTLTAQFSEGRTLLWPQIGDTLINEIEVLNRTPDDSSSSEGGLLKLSRDYTITSFDSGSFLIPPFVFSFIDDTLIEVATEPLQIMVKTIEVDTTEVFKDIKSPFNVPYTLKEFLPQILLALAILLSLLIAYFFYKKLRMREKTIKHIIKPSIPPHVIALEHLKLLEDKKLWQQNKVKLYYSDLTEITRTYIENRFDVIAMEQTTHETLAAMNYVPISKESKEDLGHILRLADLVKFAKYLPLANEHELCMKKAYDFVNATKLISSGTEADLGEAEIVDNPPG